MAAMISRIMAGEYTDLWFSRDPELAAGAARSLPLGRFTVEDNRIASQESDFLHRAVWEVSALVADSRKHYSIPARVNRSRSLIP